MALETKLFQKMTQQLVMTPQLRQAIKILQVSRTELETLIDEEMAENPVLDDSIVDERGTLELTPETPRVDGVVADNEALPEPEKTREQTASDLGDIDWKDYFESYGSEYNGATASEVDSGDDERRPALENVLTRTQSLADHLQWQLGLSTFPEDEERIAELLIGNVNVDLMPEPRFTKEWREVLGLPLFDAVMKVKRIFRVSYRTVLHRLDEIGIKDVWRRFMAQAKVRLGRSLTRTDEPDPLTPAARGTAAPEPLRGREPFELAPSDFDPDRRMRLIRRALDERRMSLSRAAEILGLDLRKMRDLHQSWA
jgi:hypothetical protein